MTGAARIGNASGRAQLCMTISFDGPNIKKGQGMIMASGSTIHIGTCSWAEKSLLESGAFYPAGVSSAEERLRFYSTRFDTVEVDATYYAIPAVTTTAPWAERTPADFLFSIKVGPGS